MKEQDSAAKSPKGSATAKNAKIATADRLPENAPEKPARTLQTPNVPSEKLAAARKRLQEMNLLDDFLFSSVVSFPEIGEAFARILLRTIFGREFQHLSVTAQKVYYGTDTDLHGARLDVYLEPDEMDAEERTTVYDLEPDQNEKATNQTALPRRVRFYHGKIAAQNLHSGTDYSHLKDVIVIMILPYDPFNLGRMLYTIKNRCLEEPQMEYEDGASTLFLYTRGTKEIPSEKLKQFLRYIENSTYENAIKKCLFKALRRMLRILPLSGRTFL